MKADDIADAQAFFWDVIGDRCEGLVEVSDRLMSAIRARGGK